MEPVSFKTFRTKLARHRKEYRKFITRTENKPPKGINVIRPEIEKRVWAEIDCLSCGNCCKVMTPTFTWPDIIRISAHLGMTAKEFSKKWLKKDEDNDDMVNVTQPCQFLDLNNNMCSIYEVRPADCAGFPHLTKGKWREYAHVHKQNIDYCPATFKMIEELNAMFNS